MGPSLDDLVWSVLEDWAVFVACRRLLEYLAYNSSSQKHYHIISMMGVSTFQTLLSSQTEPSRAATIARTNLWYVLMCYAKHRSCWGYYNLMLEPVLPGLDVGWRKYVWSRRERALCCYNGAWCFAWPHRTYPLFSSRVHWAVCMFHFDNFEIAEFQKREEADRWKRGETRQLVERRLDHPNMSEPY